MVKKQSPVWYTSIVFQGNKIGRTIGFPTVNLDPSIFPSEKKEGVYAAFVRHKHVVYPAALYSGPRLVLGETKKVLEIFIMDFDQNIYGKTIEFHVKDFIREVKNFPTLDKFQQQLEKDVKKIAALLDKKS